MLPSHPCYYSLKQLCFLTVVPSVIILKQRLKLGLCCPMKKMSWEISCSTYSPPAPPALWSFPVKHSCLHSVCLPRCIVYLLKVSRTHWTHFLPHTAVYLRPVFFFVAFVFSLACHHSCSWLEWCEIMAWKENFRALLLVELCRKTGWDHCCAL